jgi:hypothetical protein
MERRIQRLEAAEQAALGLTTDELRELRDGVRAATRALGPKPSLEATVQYYRQLDGLDEREARELFASLVQRGTVTQDELDAAMGDVFAQEGTD